MGKPIVVQYKNPESLFDGRIYYGGLVITAMQQMKAAYFKKNICTEVQEANMVLRILLPAWYDPLLSLQQYRVLTNAVQSFVQD